MEIAIIGCGAMGSAMARGFAKQGHSLILVDNKHEHAVALAKEVKGRAEKSLDRAEVVVLAMKPQHVHTAKFNQAHLVLSVLGGVSLEKLNEHFPDVECVRLMPNLGVAIGEGVVSVSFAENASKETKEKALVAVEGLGLIKVVKEELIEAVIAVAGSGMGLICVMLEAMVDGGIRLGLKAGEAQEMALQAMKGTAHLAGELSPEVLRRRVCSPGGSTIRGVVEMEKRGVRAGIIAGMLKTAHQD